MALSLHPLYLVSASKHNSQAKELHIFKIACMRRSEVVTYFILSSLKILFRPPPVFITQQRHVAKPSCCKEIKLHCGSLVVYLNQQRFDKCVVQSHVLVRCHVLRVVGSWDGECVAAVNSIPCHKSSFQFVNRSASKAFLGTFLQVLLNEKHRKWVLELRKQTLPRDFRFI